MKTIIVPTDFSACATNALYYALYLSRLTGAKVYVLHVCKMTLESQGGRLSAIGKASDLALQQAKANMLKLTEELDNDGFKNVEVQIRSGFFDNELIEMALQYKADLVVMGTNGADGLLDNFFGSNTAAIIERRVFPVLAVPENARDIPASNVVLATDYNPLSSKMVLDPLLGLASSLSAHIKVLYIDQHPGRVNSIQRKSEAQLEELLIDFKPSFYISEEADVYKGINAFTHEEDADLLVMISRPKSILQQILNQSHTRHMVLNTSLPLLVLPDTTT